MNSSQLINKLIAAAGSSEYGQELISQIEQLPEKGIALDCNSVKYWLYERLAYKKDWYNNHMKEGEKEKTAQDARDIAVIESFLSIVGK